MEHSLDLSVIIVNYKVRELVRHLLQSIFAHTRGVSFEVFIVDNSSGDGTPEIVRREFPQVTVIANATNVGFAKANNQAIRLARGRHILFLNPDTELIEDAPSAMIRFADSHPNAAVVGCKILNPERTVQKSVLSFPSLCSQGLIMLKLHHLAPWIPCLRRYFLPSFDYNRTQTVDQVMGSAFLITPMARDRLGLFDERFFLWFEEVDYCKRAKDADMEVWYMSESKVIHHGGQSFAQVFAPKKQKYFDDSLAKYMRKHHGLFAGIIIRALHPLAMTVSWLVGIFGIKRKKYA